MSKMTALDDYLARQRETLRAATPRPWTVIPHDDYDEAIVAVAEPGVRRSMHQPIAECKQECDNDEDAALIVSAVNDREALLDAVELLAKLQAWIAGLPFTAGASNEADAEITAVLSRLTADSPT